jgi:hypothetical protein
VSADGPSRGRAVGGLIGAFLAGAALPALATRAGLAGHLSWEGWVHESAGHFDWTPFIHPPLYNEFLWLGEQASRLTGERPAVLLALVNVLLAGLVAAAVGRATLKRCGPRFAVLAVTLVALSTATMRPFEQYPFSRLLVVLTVLGCLALARGHDAGRRGLAIGTFVCGLLAVEMHVNAWLVLGPLLVVLAWSNPARRRPLLVLLGALLLAFGASTFTGLWQVLADGPMNEPGWRPPMSWWAVTLEWSNYLLLAPLLLWVWPAVRRRCSPRVGAALAAALGVHLAVVVGQMYAGLAIGGTRYSSHHYFELVDGVMVLAAVWALHDVSSRRGGRWVAIAGAAGLLAFQVWLVRQSWWALTARMGSGDSWL